MDKNMVNNTILNTTPYDISKGGTGFHTESLTGKLRYMTDVLQQEWEIKHHNLITYEWRNVPKGL